MEKSSRYGWVEGTNPDNYSKVFISIIYHKNSHSGNPPLEECYTLPKEHLPSNLINILFPKKTEHGRNYKSFTTTHPNLRTAMSIIDREIYLSTQSKSEDKDFIPEKDPYQNPASDRIRSLVELRTFLHKAMKTTRRATLETVIWH